MDITTNSQAIIFLLCVLCGIVIGLVFDLFRVQRTFSNASKTSLAMSDIIFWLIASLLAIEFIVFFNNGVLRFFEFLGFALGALIYFSFLSKFFRKIISFLLKIMNWIAIILLRIIFFPLILIYKIFKKPYFTVIYGFKSSSKRLSRFAKKI